MSAMVGALGLRPTLRAIEAGKDIAFANKEVLVVAGEVVTRAAARNQVRLLPVDSEHNALFQCIEGSQRSAVKRIILTASGGPFRTLPIDRFESITVADALKHPTWQMGSKITIDSATLMNKGLEVIEARWLFGLEAPQISDRHPSAKHHSFDGRDDRRLGAGRDGDTRHGDSGRLRAGLSGPSADGPFAPLSLVECGTLTFEEPDFGRFPCLRLAYEALRAGGTMPACLNAANEELVAGFLANKIRFPEIPRHIETVMGRHHGASGAQPRRRAGNR